MEVVCSGCSDLTQYGETLYHEDGKNCWCYQPTIAITINVLIFFALFFVLLNHCIIFDFPGSLIDLWLISHSSFFCCLYYCTLKQWNYCTDVCPNLLTSFVLSLISFCCSLIVLSFFSCGVLLFYYCAM